MRVSSIYVLTPVGSTEVRYVGKTTNRRARMSLHIHEAMKDNAKTHCARWIRSLGGRVEMHVIAQCPASESGAAEMAAIAAFRFSGCDLTNLTHGGDGGSGPKSEATREKIRRAAMGRVLSAETKAKMSASRRGKPKSAEWVEKIAAAHRGMKRSQEARARMSEAAKRRCAMTKEQMDQW